MKKFIWVLVAILLVTAAFAQETTGGLQGTVKDPSGAVLSKATVEITGSALIGAKKVETDQSGYYRFANLPPGDYTITVVADKFKTLKRAGVRLEVGKLPTLDLNMEVGAGETVVEVTGAAPLIDVTVTKTQTNVTAADLASAPQGRSFQSVILFSPGARNEPLQGVATGGNGYQIGGAAQNENQYLIEGQDTARVLNGNSAANTPFEFIQEVQVKSSGIEAEHAGALGGVVNVIQKRGSNAWHGQFWTYFENNALDATNPYGTANSASNRYLRQDPVNSTNTGPGTGRFDPVAQIYDPKKDRFTLIQPGVEIGGPIAKDRLWFYLSTAPAYRSIRRSVDYGLGYAVTSVPPKPQLATDPNYPTGVRYFTADRQTYYTTSRVDYRLSDKVRLFGSWLYQFERSSGALPNPDSTSGLVNNSTFNPMSNYSHSLGYVQPNQLYNLGGDITLTPELVATTRFGHFFYNYKDTGYPNGNLYNFRTTTGLDLNHLAQPTGSNLQQGSGFSNFPLAEYYTKDADKHDQFTQDLAFFKKGLLGTHNFKAGFQMNKISNDTDYQYHNSLTRIVAGGTAKTDPVTGVVTYSYSRYTANSAEGATACGAITAYNALHFLNNGSTSANNCRGNNGYIVVREYATIGMASSTNYGIYFQDAWTLGKGITVNAGLRMDKENLPKYPNETVLSANPIQFGFGDKLAPRIGAAWDVMQNGKMKVFGSYGVFYDQMKLNLARGSFGGDYWHDCAYANYLTDVSKIVPIRSAGNHYCAGGATSPATMAAVPNDVVGGGPGLQFIENIDFRGSEGVDPNIKPYRQHESVLGVDYQLAKNWALEVRWDRRRLDRAIEDAGIVVNGSEEFSIVNPGEGINAVVGGCPTCPANLKPMRNYDGVEVRLTKSVAQHWFGQVSYTWSKLYGNYSGLTSSDLSDGGAGGRTDPNNNRTFDEPYFQFNAYGKSNEGILATDRPNAFKAYGYYTLPIGRSTTTVGLFQQLYSGSPLASYLDVGNAGTGSWSVYPEGHGKWVDVTRDPVSGALTVGNPYVKRTPAYNQTDARFVQEFKLSKDHESWVLGFEGDVSNLFNLRKPVAYYEQINSMVQASSPILIGASYSTLMSAYDYKTALNTNGTGLNTRYGMPLYWQAGRTVRLKARFNF